MTHVYRVRPGKREDFWEGRKRDGVVRRGMVRELAKGWFDGYEGIGGVGLAVRLYAMCATACSEE